MKLHQLRYLAAVSQSGLNITAAAQKLHTSQPGVSKQIKLLEDELGFQIFVREGRNLTRITPAGQQVIERALKILQEAQSIRDLSTPLAILCVELMALNGDQPSLIFVSGSKRAMLSQARNKVSCTRSSAYSRSRHSEIANVRSCGMAASMAG